MHWIAGGQVVSANCTSRFNDGSGSLCPPSRVDAAIFTQCCGMPRCHRGMPQFWLKGQSLLRSRMTLKPPCRVPCVLTTKTSFHVSRPVFTRFSVFIHSSCTAVGFLPCICPSISPGLLPFSWAPFWFAAHLTLKIESSLSVHVNKGSPKWCKEAMGRVRRRGLDGCSVL